MQGKPIRGIPVFIMNSAGEWLFDSVKTECRNAILSTCRPRFGKISETILPDPPRGVNRNGDFISAPTWFLKKPVVFWNVGSNSRIDLPCQRSSAGLYSQVSTWLGPPLVKTQMTRLARAAKCPGRAAIGLSDSVRGGALATEQTLAVEQGRQPDQTEPAAGTLEPSAAREESRASHRRSGGSWRVLRRFRSRNINKLIHAD